MANAIFLLVLSGLFSAIIVWGCKVLPREGWQILASLPALRDGEGRWRGRNLTWYGVLTANAYLAAVCMLLILLGTLRLPVAATVTIAGILLTLCVPASRLIARLVEGKAHTFTVGGAVFVGILAAPWAVALANYLPWHGSQPVPVIPVLAALSIAYAFGEGLGRLACISFGCCYGKPLSETHPVLARVFRRRHFVFAGATKKIAYAGGLEGIEVVPVQAITSVLYVGAGILATALFLTEHFAAALSLAAVTTQGWRFLSEALRADYRGEGKLSVYQLMALAAILYLLGMVPFFPTETVPSPEVLAGLEALWNPALLLLLQGLWIFIFLYTGRSSVTGATLSFHVHSDRI